MPGAMPRPAPGGVAMHTPRRSGRAPAEIPSMHPELREARSLYHEWRHLPERELGRIAPFAREVKELALDLRGRVDTDEAIRELAQANAVLRAMLRSAELSRAA